jgi:hypothetical protein
MLSNTHALNNETLSDALFRVIADGEDFRNAPYFDTANPPRATKRFW